MNSVTSKIKYNLYFSINGSLLCRIIESYSLPLQFGTVMISGCTAVDSLKTTRRIYADSLDDTNFKRLIRKEIK